MITIKYSLPKLFPFYETGKVYDDFVKDLKALMERDGKPKKPLYRVVKLKLVVQHGQLQMNNPIDAEKLVKVGNMLVELDVIQSTGVRCLRQQVVQSFCPEQRGKSRTDIFITFDETHFKHKPVKLSQLPILWELSR